MPGVELVVLDVDGVIRDSSALVYECHRNALQKAGLEKEFRENFTVNDLWHFRGLGKFNNKRLSLMAVAVLLKTGDAKNVGELISRTDAESYIMDMIDTESHEDVRDAIDAMVSAYGAVFNSDEANALTCVYPGVEEALDRLDNGDKRLAIATNSGLASIKRDLQADLLKRFERIVTPDDVKTPKPCSGGITLLSSALRIAPGRIVYVGDTTTDVRAAKDAKCVSASLLSGMGLRQHIEPEEPDHIFRNLKEACDWILNQ
jgi:phosphoglycolate phosphatase-like HAD superfamily hydrolase